MARQARTAASRRSFRHSECQERGRWPPADSARSATGLTGLPTITVQRWHAVTVVHANRGATPVGDRPASLQVCCASDYHLATPGMAALARRESIYLDQRFSDHAPLTIDYDFGL